MSLLTSLESLLASTGATDATTAAADTGSQFRCWVTAQATEDIPVRLLQTAVKIMADSPRVSKHVMTIESTRAGNEVMTILQG